MQKIWQQLYTETGEFRYERKFFIDSLTKHEVEAIINLHPAMFREIFYERFVNNIYLDSFDLKDYFDNQSGAGDRCKARIRWYGDFLGFVQKPALELKMKNNSLAAKATYPLEGFMMDNNFSFDILERVFKVSRLPDWLRTELKTMEPSLFNRYKRRYFQSYDKAFRFTVDSEIQSFQPSKGSNMFLNSWIDFNGIILELKYKRDEDDAAQNITNFLPFRMTRSSKYVSGIESLNMW